MDKLRIRVITAIGAAYMYPGGLSEIKEVATAEDINSFRIDLTIKLDGKLQFMGEDYEYWNRLDTSAFRCETTSIQIQRLVRGTSHIWQPIRESTMSMRDGKWNRSKCTVEFALINNDRYDPLDNDKEKEYNAFELATKRYPAQWTGLAVPCPNGVRVYDVIYGMMNDIYGSISVKSDFFQWDSDDPGYTIGNNVALKYLLLFQKSDVTRRAVTTYTPATKMTLKPIQLIEDLCKLFNLRYRIDENGTFRIEHVSWWIRTVGLDLTQEPYAHQLKGLNKYEYYSEKYVRREVFKSNKQEITLTYTVDLGMPDGPSEANTTLSNPQMVGVPIEYDNACTNALDSENTNTYEVSLITDIIIHAGDGLAPPDSDFEGTFILATDIDGNVLDEPVIWPKMFDGSPLLFRIVNNVLGFPQLHNNYYRHDRFFKVGIMNEEETEFFTTKRMRVQKDMQFTLCTSDKIDSFKLVRDELGDGVIDNYSYNFATGLVKLDLSQAYDISTAVTVPVANDDAYPIEEGVILDTELEGKPSLLANDVGAISVFAETKSTYRGGVVIIKPNGHFIYNPPAGISGQDTFEYAALNSNGNAALAVCRLGVRPEMVYVRKESVSEGGFLNTYARWYKDLAGTIPIDVTAMGITLHYSVTLPVVDIPVAATGTSQLLESINTIPPISLCQILTDPMGYYTIIP